jgi:hypothetical protein
LEYISAIMKRRRQTRQERAGNEPPTDARPQGGQAMEEPAAVEEYTRMASMAKVARRYNFP